MYSRNRGNVTSAPLPPRYSGVRFRNERRADGRDFAVEEPLPVPVAAEEVAPERTVGGKPDRLAKLLSGIGADDLLLAALIIILAGEGESSREAVLLLLLLLCIR